MEKKRTARISTFGSQITSIISVSLVLLILGILAMTLQASHTVGDRIRSNMGFVVKIDPTATDADVARVMAKVKGTKAIQSFAFASAENILIEESERMGQDLGDMLDENPFGAEVDVKVRPEYADADSIAMLAAGFELDPAVEEAVAEAETVRSVNSVISRLTIILLAMAAALLIISFVLINNTVSLAVYSRRFIIHTMKLVGATGAFIRRPFLLAGLWTGVAAAVIAIGLLAGLRAYASTFDPIVDELLNWPTMTCIFVAVTIVGLIICTVASAIATNRYLRAQYDDMFK